MDGGQVSFALAFGAVVAGAALVVTGARLIAWRFAILARLFSR